MIIAGILVVVLIAGVIALPFILPLEKIKDFAVARISETINREVKIEKVSFNIFTGIQLEKLSISNRRGFADKPFVSADAIALRYAFWPLFKRQILIKEIRLVKPEILIEKSARGDYNFSDMMQRRAPKPKEKEEKEPSFSMVVDTFSIRKGRITYTDYGTKATSEIKDANLTVSGITLALLKPIDLKFNATAVYQEKDIPLSLDGKIAADLEKDAINIPSLSLNIAGEKAAVTANVSRLRTGPSIDFTIFSKKLSLDPLLAIFTGVPKKKEKPERGELTKTVNRLTASIPARLKLKGEADIENLSFQEIRVDKAKLGISLSNKYLIADIKEIRAFDGTLSGKAGVNLAAYGLSYNVSKLELSKLNASPFSNAMVETFLTKLPDYKDLLDKVYGTLDASLTLAGRGVEVPDIMANANVEGSFSLTNGELKRLKTIDAIADKIKVKALKQDLKISELSGGFAYKNQIVTIKKLSLVDHDIQAGFNGGLDLGNLQYVSGNRLTLKGSPGVTKDLPKEFELFRDEKGWVEMTFELKGSLKTPIPVPVLEKPVEKVIEKVKVKIEAKKVEIEEKAKEKVEEEKRKAEEEAKKKLEEEAKRKLQEMFK